MLAADSQALPLRCGQPPNRLRLLDTRAPLPWPMLLVRAALGRVALLQGLPRLLHRLLVMVVVAVAVASFFSCLTYFWRHH